MDVNSVSYSIDLTTSSGVKPRQEQNEAHQSGRNVTSDNDSDSQATLTAEPTVNTSGQTVGTIINTKVWALRIHKDVAVFSVGADFQSAQ